MIKNPFKNNRGKKKMLLLIVLLMGIFAFLPFISSAPSISITYPPNNTNSSDINLDINYFVSEIDLDSCWYSDNLLENISLGTGGICVNITEAIWIDGIHDIIIWANDTLGDENSSSVRFTINTTVPEINIIYPLNTIYNFNISELNYTSNGVSCWYSLNLGVTNSTSQTCGTNWTNLTSTEGSNTWTVYANNSLDNEAFDIVNFVVDTINPSISIIYPQNTIYYSLVSTLNYIFTEINLNTCWYSLDNGETNLSAMACIGNEGRGRGGGRGGCEGTWTCINLIELTSNKGSNTWTVWINDTAGNENSSSVNFVISSWTSETGAVVYNLMDSAGAGLGIVITYISQSIFGLLVLIALITVFAIIGYAVARTIIEQLKNSQK